MQPGAFDLLTVEQVAQLTHRSESAVRAGLKRGELPAVKLGRRWFVRRRDIDQLFEQAARGGRECS